MHIITQMHNMSLKSVSHEGSLELRNSSILTETEVQTPQTDDQARSQGGGSRGFGLTPPL